MFLSFVSCLITSFTTANAIPQGIFFGPDGTVGASFGGYHASAGLGGLLSGGPKGGLHAQAGTPLGHFASAGLAGNVAAPGGPQGIKYASAVKPGTSYVVQPAPQPQNFQLAQPQPQPVYVQQPQPTYIQQPQPTYVQQPAGSVQRPGGFNDIFNIPISTLQAVNQYLNNRPKVALYPVGPAYITGRSNKEAKSYSQGESMSSSKAASSSLSSSSASSSSSSTSSSSSHGNAEPVAEVPANAVQGVLVSKSYPTKYDDIFNIPISVLKSVNNLLSG